VSATGAGFRSLGATATHYDTLGIDAAASQQEIRRAYRTLARQLHPDRHQQSQPAEASAAARRMSDINAAWSVLSNPAAKELYDLELRLAVRSGGPSVATAPTSSGWSSPSGSSGPTGRAGAPGAHGAPGTGFPRPSGPTPSPAAPTDGHPVIRGLLWFVVLGVLAAIFVFTAYAASGSNDRPGTGVRMASTTSPTIPRVEVDVCVDQLAGAMELVDCAGPHDARVAAVVPIGRPCPGGTRDVYLPDQQEVACLAAGG
jgi:DnaJ-domain-containing protein 1